MNNQPTQVSGKPVRRLGPGDELEMIDSPHLWPLWPVLPMKNYTKLCPLTGQKPMTGLIVAGNVTTVLIGTLGLTDWMTAEEMVYASVQEMLVDGWIVD